ncbi:Disintegrin and metalloproteinase domain-containing protein 29, partial [Frankliniella fusca]
ASRSGEEPVRTPAPPPSLCTAGGLPARRSEDEPRYGLRRDARHNGAPLLLPPPPPVSPPAGPRPPASARLPAAARHPARSVQSSPAAAPRRSAPELLVRAAPHRAAPRSTALCVFPVVSVRRVRPAVRPSVRPSVR